MYALAAYVLLFGVVAFGLTKLSTVGRRPKGLPPGPPTIPILGNMHLMPKKDAHLQFQKWAQEYGPVYSLILGTKILIVLSSDIAVKELLDKRSAIYSDRQPMYMAQDLVSGGLRLVLMSYGPTWRSIRKTIHSLFNIVASKSYIPYQDLENKQMLVDLLDQPTQFINHIRRYSNSLTTQMVFGFRTSSFADPKLQQLFEGVEKWSQVTGNGVAVLVDLFPILRYLPDFMLPMRAYCKKLHVREKELYVGHWLNAKRELKAGTLKPCFSKDLVNAQVTEGFSDDLAGYIVGSLLEAGSDTTAATLVGFMQAMVLYPDVQKHAQAELDNVVGPERLPTLDDEMKLQYIRGCVKETMRWMPTAILGIAHAVTKDDWYEGHLIPKGAGIVNNVWTIHMDPARHENPTNFNPARYASDFQTAKEAAANPDVSQRDHFVFGTGRRVCQGMHIAERSLFLAISRILWGFNIEAARDEAGEKIMPDPKLLTQGLLVQPLPFLASIKPRSEKREARMREAWQESRELLDDKFQWTSVPESTETEKRS